MDELPAPPARHRGGAPSGPTVDQRAADLGRFLADARERSLATGGPALGRTRRREEPPRGGDPRRGAGVRHRRPGVLGVVGLVALLVVLAVAWAAHSGRPSPPAAAASITPVLSAASATAGPRVPGVGRTPAAVRPSGPASTASPVSAPVPLTPPATVPPTVSTTVPVTRREVVAVVPVEVPAAADPAGSSATRPSWTTVVQALLRTRSAAFAAGRPDLLPGADAAGSAVLAADRTLFARSVRAVGYDRVLGLGFDLTAVRATSLGDRWVRLGVTGRQTAAVLVGPRGRRLVPAGPSVTMAVELSRTVGGPWRIARSRPS